MSDVPYSFIFGIKMVVCCYEILLLQSPQKLGLPINRWSHTGHLLTKSIILLSLVFLEPTNNINNHRNGCACAIITFNCLCELRHYSPSN